MTTPWTVPRDWVGETVAVLASGPSMCATVANAVRDRCRVIAVNNQGIEYEVGGVKFPALAPWADMLYAADAKWWEHYRQEALKFVGDKVTVRSIVPYPEVLSLDISTKHVAFDDSPRHVVTGGNGGYQAVHIAAQRGAARILLCGFDMREVNGKKHWFGSYPGRLDSKQTYRRWIASFERLAVALKERGVEVLNCTPGSALVGFRRVTLEEALDGN